MPSDREHGRHTIWFGSRIAYAIVPAPPAIALRLSMVTTLIDRPSEARSGEPRSSRSQQLPSTLTKDGPESQDKLHLSWSPLSDAQWKTSHR